jgi:hypothetical protein
VAALLVALPLVPGFPADAAAQEVNPLEVSAETFAGSELEHYLRILQTTGKVPLYPWSLRGYSPGEVRELSPLDGDHPWARRYSFQSPGRGGLQTQIVRPTIRTIYNSKFPYGDDRGPLWAGRGLSGEISGGISVQLGPISAALVPTIYGAQNLEFDLSEHEFSETDPYNDARRPLQIDLPQRPGDSSTTQVDPGNSYIRVDGAGLTAGFSTANQVWGPANRHSLILGANAGGFAHFFAGTSRPVNIWIAKVHARALWARLDQSEYSPVPADSAHRFASGVIATVTPRGIPGLEIGAIRFFHSPWVGGISRTQLLAPFETFVKQSLLDRDQEELEASVVANQLVSVFGRWVFPGSGLEIFGELASEDHRHNFRDLALQPDHATALTLGLIKVWTLPSSELISLQIENLESSGSHLGRNRRQEPFYIHASTRQGHTQRGQVLGSPGAYGGGASMVALGYHHEAGRVSLEWNRLIRSELGEYLESGVTDKPDVIHSLGAEALLFRGGWDITAGLNGAYNLNRNFDDDVFNFGVTLGVRAPL